MSKEVGRSIVVCMYGWMMDGRGSAYYEDPPKKMCYRQKTNECGGGGQKPEFARYAYQKKKKDTRIVRAMRPREGEGEGKGEREGPETSFIDTKR